LIDTNICSAYLKGDRNVWGKFLQYLGGSAISVITAGELWTWVQRGNASLSAKKTVMEFIDSMDIIEVDWLSPWSMASFEERCWMQGHPCQIWMHCWLQPLYTSI
jgi:predicted nucleic acid-binding protein